MQGVLGDTYVISILCLWGALNSMSLGRNHLEAHCSPVTASSSVNFLTNCSRHVICYSSFTLTAILHSLSL